MLGGVLAIGVVWWGVLHRHDTATMNEMVIYFRHLREAFPFLGIAVFGLMQTIVALCGVLPASVGAIVSGMVFGVLDGFLVAAVATLVGALGAFWLSRSLLRTHIQKFLERRRFLLILEHMAEDQGWKIVCLLRISPVLPFAITSYALGLTALSTTDYLIGTLASLPALLGYVVIGHLTQDGMGHAAMGTVSWVRLTMTGVAIVGTGLLVWQFGRATAHYLRSTSDETVV